METTTEEESKIIRYKNVSAVLTLSLLGVFFTMTTSILMYHQQTVMDFLLRHYYEVVIIFTILSACSSIVYGCIAAYEDNAHYKFALFGLDSVLSSVFLLNVPPTTLVVSLYRTMLTLLGLFIASLFVPNSVADSLRHPMRALNFLILLTSSYFLLFPQYRDHTTDILKDFSKYGGLLAHSVLFVCNLRTLKGNVNEENFDAIHNAGYIYVNMLSVYFKVISYMSNECRFAFFCAND